MKTPLVSVVTPSYNQGRFIRATIESVLSQDYPHVEYIIMDGGSTDETAAVVRDYASRLTFISEKDRGQSHAINKGFQMARGPVISWLNSDDLYLPGAIRTAVDGFTRNPAAGAVYGEGYLIDLEGRISGRFPCTEPINLWKLVHLSDYILQQTVFFRKDVLDDIGYLDEELHYTMDWDILIRIASRYPLEYIPEYMGCLREYAEAKSSAGGMRRIRELRNLLRRHTGSRWAPGYIVYGLDTYHRIWCERIERIMSPRLKSVSNKAQLLVRLAAGLIIGRTIRNSQGLYADGWGAPLLRFMLSPGSGDLILEGALPDWAVFRGQKLCIHANGWLLGEFPVTSGDFQFRVDVPADLQRRLLNLTISACRSVKPGRFTLRGDRRRLAYQLKSIRWSHAAGTAAGMFQPAVSATAGS
jgi:glycosyltransferase involved in cell wall biosynthesis